MSGSATEWAIAATTSTPGCGPAADRKDGTARPLTVLKSWYSGVCCANSAARPSYCRLTPPVRVPTDSGPATFILSVVCRHNSFWGGAQLMRNYEIVELIADEQPRLARELAELPVEAWKTPSRCEGWTNARVVAHLALGAELYRDCVSRALNGDIAAPAGP